MLDFPDILAGRGDPCDKILTGEIEEIPARAWRAFAFPDEKEEI